MDFARVLTLVTAFLESKEFDHALIGGLSMAAHLVAMKVFAMKNDPSRTFRELADIRFLMTIFGLKRDEVRGYFEKHGLAHRYAELEETL